MHSDGKVEYGIEVGGAVVQAGLDYQQARDYADGWNATPGTVTRARVVVRRLVLTPWQRIEDKREAEGS